MQPVRPHTSDILLPAPVDRLTCIMLPTVQVYLLVVAYEGQVNISSVLVLTIRCSIGIVVYYCVCT